MPTAEAAVTNVGGNVLKTRVKRKLSRAELAALVDVSPQTIYFVELGQRTPSLALFAALCSALSTTPNKLLAAR